MQLNENVVKSFPELKILNPFSELIHVGLVPKEISNKSKEIMQHLDDTVREKRTGML